MNEPRLVPKFLRFAERTGKVKGQPILRARWTSASARALFSP